MMRPALLVGGLGETALVDEECRLLLGLRDDALRFFLGLLDDPLTLGVDALGGADLFGNGDAQLVDETERGVLIHDDVRGQGQLLAVGDEGFQPLDEENDVDRSVLLCRVEGPLRRWPELSHAARHSESRARRPGAAVGQISVRRDRKVGFGVVRGRDRRALTDHPAIRDCWWPRAGAIGSAVIAWADGWPEPCADE